MRYEIDEGDVLQWASDALENGDVEEDDERFDMLAGVKETVEAYLDPAAPRVETVRVEGSGDVLDWVEAQGGIDRLKDRLHTLHGFAVKVRGVAVEDDGMTDAASLFETEEALKRRLMPEGMEWPMYRNGEKASIGSIAANAKGEECQIGRIELTPCSYILRSDCCETITTGVYGEPVEWPATDRGGVPIGAGDALWRTTDGRKVKAVEVNPGGHVTVEDSDGRRFGCSADFLTHRAVAIALDGGPIEEGQTVWHAEDGTELKVLGIVGEQDGEPLVQVERVSGPVDWGECRASSLTHEKLAFASDGRPVVEGETLWFTTSGNEIRADKVERRLDGWWVVERFRNSAPVSVLTHREPDSWERLEEDANKNYVNYWECHRVSCYCCPAMADGKKPYERYNAANCSEAMKSDLVRRAKALAEKED